MKQLELRYAFDALQPHIDATTMETHYGKHHKAYTDNLNKFIDENPALQNRTIEDILSHLEDLDASIRAGVQNNGGGYYNHNLYFDIMSPTPVKQPEGALLEAINQTFGSVDTLKEELTKAALAQFGSGWAWLAKDATGALKVVKTANQDTPLALGLTPVLGIDVWEHAYYLNYKNLRKAYVDNFFEVLDWSKVAEYYNK